MKLSDLLLRTVTFDQVQTSDRHQVTFKLVNLKVLFNNLAVPSEVVRLI